MVRGEGVVFVVVVEEYLWCFGVCWDVGVGVFDVCLEVGD